MKKASPVSIHANLLNLAQREGLIFQFVLIRFLHERLLYRLSVSEYVSKFFLKGGALLYAIGGLHIRPTIDIDLLARHIGNQKDVIRSAFQAICSIGYEDDCVYFDADAIIAEEIKEDDKYAGVRLHIDAHFDTTRQRMQVDIGFGDVIVPAPVTLTYPVLLKDLNEPEINAYSIETVIAEKFQAMIALGTFNSRMKDFYDVYILLKNGNIDLHILQEAIFQTFQRRNTPFIPGHDLFSESFFKDKKRLTMWNAFLKKIKVKDPIDFKTVVDEIVHQLEPMYQNIRNRTNQSTS